MNPRHHITQLIGFVAFSCCLLAVVQAQTTSLDQSTTFRQLLAMPAPTPRSAEAIAEAEEAARQRPREFFDKDNAPPDEARIEDLLEYWERWAGSSSGPTPSDVVRQRLLEACVADVEELPSLLPLLSQSEATARQVKDLYDKAKSDQQLDENDLKNVREWLVYNSKYFLSELIVLANKVKDYNKGGGVDNDEALSALARVDWATAEPLLQSLVNSGQARTATVALAELYRHARQDKDSGAEDRYRITLKAIASDRNAPGRARDTAIETLSLTEWSGRDDWYLSLFEDESLLDLLDGGFRFSPLTTLFSRDPDKWIPVMTKLLQGRNQSVKDAAADCLIIFRNQDARKDALEPLLPWLVNPEWASDKSAYHRLRLIQSMSFIVMPESVPGLIWVAEYDESEVNRSYAAESLANYKDPRAALALRKALIKTKDDNSRDRVIQGLVACDGISTEEQVDALEAYANKITTDVGREDMERHRFFGDVLLPLKISIGRVLANTKDASDVLVHAVVSRADDLKSGNRTLAQLLLDVVHGWLGRQVDLDMLHRVTIGEANSNTIVGALGRRVKLRESVGTELQALVGTGGSAQGIAAVLLDDTVLAQNILGSENQRAQVALLACARLMQMALPVDQVGAALKSKNPLLALAAERYLLAEDSKEARQLLWAHHSNMAFVTGWRENTDFIDGDNFDAIGKMEDKLRAELFKENPPLEVYALFANSEHYSRVLRVYSDKAVYTHYDDPARYRERVITKEELSAFKQLVSTNNLAELGPQLGYCHNDCMALEFVVLTREKGRRMFSHQGFASSFSVTANFGDLDIGDGAKIHYNLEKEIKGLEILFADESLEVKDVWQQGAEIRIFVERDESPEEYEERTRIVDSDEEEDEASLAEYRRKEAARVNDLNSWRVFENGKAGRVTLQPAPYSTLDVTKFDIENNEFHWNFNGHLSEAVAGDFILLSSGYDGLWKQRAGEKAIRISGKGAYANPIVTPDGQWAVVAKSDSNWGVPNYVVRFNLQTGREYKIDVAAADQFEPVAFIAPHGKVLLRRAKDDDTPWRIKLTGPESPEFYLVDAVTGKVQLTTGDFAPLLQRGKRFLQPTGKPDEFWVAISDREKYQTEVGRYDLKTFTFKPLLVIPHISFDSMSMWVDEAGAKLYVVYEGQLLRLPLRTAM